jgi:hypothetical protein
MAAQIASVDLPPEECAASHSNERPNGSVTTTSKRAARQSADSTANDQPGRSVATMAVVVAIIATPYLVMSRQAALLVIVRAFGTSFIVVVLILALLILAMVSTPTMSRCPGRWIGKRDGGRYQRASENGDDQWPEHKSPCNFRWHIPPNQ